MAFDPTHCAACGFTGEVHEHHIVPKVRGGRALPTVYLCVPCHGAVHKRKWDVRHITLTKEGLAQAKAAGRVGGNPGLRARDPEAIRRLAEAAATTRLAKMTKNLGIWLPIVQKMRPKARWEDVAVAICAATGDPWNKERIRRVMLRLVAKGAADKGLMGEPRSPRPARRNRAKEKAEEIARKVDVARAKRAVRIAAVRAVLSANGSRG